MDPLSISASAAGLLTTCVQAVKIIWRTIETIKGAKEFLVELLTQTKRVGLFLEQLRSLTKQLGHRSKVLLAYDIRGPRETLDELEDFVHSIDQSKTWFRLKVLLYQNVTDKLVKRLHRHAEEIMQVMLSIVTYVSCKGAFFSGSNNVLEHRL